MAEYLDKTGLTYLWSKIKAKFDAKADKTELDTKANKSDVLTLEEIPNLDCDQYIVTREILAKLSNNKSTSKVIGVVNLIEEKEKALYKLDRVKNSVVWVNLVSSLYQDYYNIAIKENFYSLNNTVGKQLVEHCVNRSTFNKFKKAIEDYINMLTTLESKINACL